MTDFLNLRYCSSVGCELLFNQPVHVSFHAYTIILHVQRLYSRLTFAWVQLWRADAKTPICTLENIFYGPIELNFSSALRQTVRIRHPILKYIFGNQIICTIILTQRTHKFGYRITFNTRWIINSVPAGDAVACLLHPWNLFREFTLDERLAHQQPATDEEFSEFDRSYSRWNTICNHLQLNEEERECGREREREWERISTKNDFLFINTTPTHKNAVRLAYILCSGKNVSKLDERTAKFISHYC